MNSRINHHTQKASDLSKLGKENPLASVWSIEAVITLAHVHALALMTLHRSRRRDKYQNMAFGLCVIAIMCLLINEYFRRDWQSVVRRSMAVIPVTLAVGLSLSAVIHGSIYGQKKGK